MMKVVLLLLVVLQVVVVRAQVCICRIAVAIPNSNGTEFTVVDNTANKPTITLRDLDVTPYYKVPCGSINYSFYSGNTLLTQAKYQINSGEIYSLVLQGLVSPKGNVVSIKAYADNWNVTEGTAIVRFINVAPQSDTYKIEANGTVFQPTINYQQETDYAEFPSNLQYAFYVSDTSTQKVVLDEFLFLNDQTSYTMWIQGENGNLELTMTQDYPPDVPL